MLLSTSTSRWSALTTLVMLASCVTSLDANPSPQSTTPALLAMNLSKSPKVIRVVHESQDATASILSRKLDVVTPKKRQDDQLPIRRRTTASASAKKSDARKKRSLPQREAMKGRENRKNRKNKRAGFESSHIKNQLALKAKFKREKVEQVEKASKDKVNAAKTTTASGDSKPRASETKKADSKASATKKAEGTAKSKSGSATTKAGAAGAAAEATTTAPAAAAAAPATTTTPAAADAAAASVTTTSADLSTSTAAAAAAAATTPTDAKSSAGRGASLMSVGSMTGLVAVVLTILA
ncbi:BZ3500_MvSof-1268-A1-R1_Chr10-3g03077 [Microbotryum saponariae]|uniref:BZ3500_MvSof-1268-A1-R1_Chr10-3g03077 protein n=1 Tax=Microbotryum saponariae TaxID=289078 RepID=A0A2X0MAF8_9BASI|nr:BZ3501_MvSof-1269-A2-R1_Chr10-2g02655 [Microbotryum saponariae]SDA02107.1 BZ3500_MvSof-1268-A1-R1_Chr10-3g03077 [Microbotryum saponariae]